MSRPRSPRAGIALLSAVAVVALQLAVLTNNAVAATFTVTKTADTADGTCDSDCSLREAVIAANAAAGPDTISVPTGTYLLDLTGANEDAAATGDLDIADDLTITGAGAAQTIVDGNQTDRVFDLTVASLIVEVSGLTVQDGKLTGSVNVADDGAGFRVAASGTQLTLKNAVVRDNSTDSGAAGGGVFLVGDDTLTLDATRVGDYGHGNFANRGAGIKGNGSDNEINMTNGSSVSYNEALSSGGGIFLLGQSHDVTIDDSEISHNTADSGDGGGIYFHAGSTGSSLIVRNGSRINENSAGTRGGGIRSLGDSNFSLDITDSDVLGNEASLGGGLYLDDFNSSATLGGARVAFNRALNTEGCEGVGQGGGIWNGTTPAPPEDDDPPTFGLNVFDGSSIDHNWAACVGGGIYTASDASTQMQDSDVDHNLAGNDGGGMFDGAASSVLIQNSSVDLNGTANGDGGGIFNVGDLHVTNQSTIVGNSAADGDGGGLFNASPPDPPVNATFDTSFDQGGAPVIAGNTVDGSGAGIYNSPQAGLVTAGAAIVGNTAVDDHNTESSGGGGGVLNEGSYQAFDTLIGYNVAATRHGGGLWNTVDGITSGNGVLVVGNYAKGDGGGIFNESSPEDEFVGVALGCSAVASNAAANGGGIANRGAYDMGGCFGPRLVAKKKRMRRHMKRELKLANRVLQPEVDDGDAVEPVIPPIDPALFGRSLIVDNTSAEDGGGVWNGSFMNIGNTTVGGNTAPVGRGGGVFNTGGASEGFALTIDSSTLQDNFAEQKGGGLFNALDGDALMVNDTISGNFTNGTGGGIDDESGSLATTKLVHVTVVNNSAPQGNGGGLDASLDAPGDIEVASSVVALNLGGDCSSPIGITSEDYNFSGDATCGFLQVHDQGGGGDPGLGPLTDNGGPTETHLPNENSPLVDLAEPGDPPPCVAGGEEIERDQRGEIRPENFRAERCDIGSVELQFSDVPPSNPRRGGFTTHAAQTGPTYVPNTTADHVPDGCDDFQAEVFDCTLREAVIAANADGVDSTINVPAGRFVLRLPGDEDGALTGDLDVTDDLTVNGSIADDGSVGTIVDGNQLDRVFDMNPDNSSPAPIVALEDLVIQNGDAEDGGGIRNSAQLGLNNTYVVFNRALCAGGGIFNINLLTITGGGVIKNGVRGSECVSSGGGIFTTSPTGSANLSDTAVDLNNAFFRGAGLYNDGTGAATALDVDESEISLNVLTRQPDCEGSDCNFFGGGGGIYNETTARLVNTDVIGNVTRAGLGGGIYNGGTQQGASLVMNEENLVAANVAGGVGGGLYADEGSMADIGGASFVDNTSSGGGAIYQEGDLLTSGETLYLMNTALGGGGGALWNASGRTTIQSGDILFNRATTSVQSGDPTLGGGGIQNDSDGTGAIDIGEETSGVVVTDSGIVGNAAPSAQGGGVNNRGTMYLDESDVFDNSASAQFRGGGGAINCHILFVDDTTVDGNIAPDGSGGGLLNRETCNTNRTLHITNSTVSANASLGDGGGVRNDVGTTDVLNSTFSGNFTATGSGGGLDELSIDTTHLHNVTVAFNSAPFGSGGGVSADGGADVTALNTLVGVNYGGDCDALLTSEGHNLDSDGSCFDGPTDVTHPGTFLDPKLGPLALNGNPALTETHALLDGSPAIDKTPDDEECPDTDQRHVTRPQGELCDIGAYERELVAPSPSPSPTPSQSQPPSGGGGGASTTDLAVTKKAEPEPVVPGGTLTYTIAVTNNGPVTATGVTLTDNLPSGVSFQSVSTSQGSCSGTATITCDLGNLPNGAKVTVTIVVTVTAQSGSVTNSAAVEGHPTDSNPGNNRADVTSTLITASPSPTSTGPPPTEKCPGFENDPRPQIVGTENGEKLVGTADSEIICGLGGNDLLKGLGGDDLLIGNGSIVVRRPDIHAAASTDNDSLRGSKGNDVLFGNGGNDRMRGGAGDDKLFGQGGKDKMGATFGIDYLVGGRGRDNLRGGPDADSLRGGNRADIVAGTNGPDILRGGRGNDILKGKRGDDNLIGGRGTDQEDGGIGTDVCVEADDFRVHCES